MGRKGDGIASVAETPWLANEVRMQVLLLVAVVLISIATALASAAAVLSLLFHLISKLP